MWGNPASGRTGTNGETACRAASGRSGDGSELQCACACINHPMFGSANQSWNNWPTVNQPVQNQGNRAAQTKQMCLPQAPAVLLVVEWPLPCLYLLHRVWCGHWVAECGGVLSPPGVVGINGAVGIPSGIAGGSLWQSLGTIHQPSCAGNRQLKKPAGWGAGPEGP